MTFVEPLLQTERWPQCSKRQKTIGLNRGPSIRETEPRVRGQSADQRYFRAGPPPPPSPPRTGGGGEKHPPPRLPPRLSKDPGPPLGIPPPPLATGARCSPGGAPRGAPP